MRSERRCLLVCLLAGEAIHRLTGLPLPGSVIGLGLLLAWLGLVRRERPTLGLVRAIRQGICAASSAWVAALRNTQGASNMINGNDESSRAASNGTSRAPIQCICVSPKRVA